jgi:hypothetical protein
METYGRELLLDEAQGLIMASQGLNHLIRVVEDDHLRPDTGQGMREFTCGAVPGVEAALSVC